MAQKNYFLVTLYGGVTSPVACTPAQWVAGIWKREKAALAKNPEHKPQMPALVHSERITESEFTMLMDNFPLAKPQMGEDRN